MISAKFTMKSSIKGNQNRFIKSIFTLIILLSFQTNIWAQSSNEHEQMSPPTVSPVIIETMIGNNGLNVQTIFLKPFSARSRFGVFGIADAYGVYNPKEQAIKNQQMAQTHLTYRIAKGLNVSAGALFEKHSGFRPTLGLQYNLFRNDFHLLLAPRVDLSQTYNGEMLTIVEYTPTLKGDWKLYTRAQGLYNQDFKNDIHSVSYVWGRIGVSYKNYRFGIGANYYWLGPKKITENNVGLFLGVLLF